MGITCVRVGLLLLIGANAWAQESRPETRRGVETPALTRARDGVAAADRDFGPDSLRAASARRALAQRLAAEGDLSGAIHADQGALAILERNPTAKPGQFAATRGELALLNYRQNRLEEALAYATAAVANAEAGYGPTDPRTSKIIYLLAGIEFELGHLERAERATRRAIDILRAAPVEDANDFVRCLLALGDVLTCSGRYGEARAVLTEATTIASSDPSVSATTAAVGENALGVLEDSLGRFGEARQRFERQLVLLQTTASVQGADIPLTLANIAHVLWESEDAAAARVFFERAIAACVEGRQTRPLGYVLTELALLELASGRLDAGHALAVRAVAAERACTEINPARLGRAIRVEAVFLHALRRPADALPRLDEAMLLVRQALGDASREVSAILDARARALMALGRREEARATFRAALESARRWFASATEALSEAERLSSVWPIRSLMDGWLATALGDPGQAGSIADAVLAWQGQVLRAVGAERTWLRAHADPETVALRSRLARIVDDLAPERLLGRTSPTGPAASADTHALIADRERIERELATRTGRASNANATAEAISAALEPGEALVDYFVFDRIDPGAAIRGAVRQPCLLAIVLRRGEPPVVVDLGPLQAVRDATMAHLMVVSRSMRPDPAAGPIVQAVGAAARRVLWDPIEPLIGRATRVFVVPDSFISTLPFETLPGRGVGSFLVEDVEIVYLPMASERLRGPSGGAGRGALLVGGVDFGVAHEGETGEVRAMRGDFGLPLSPLPRTAAEVASVADALTRSGVDAAEIVVLGGSAATEAAVKEAAVGKRFIHIATHAIFAATPEVRGQGAESRITVRTPTALDGLVPLTRTAIALAGVNAAGGHGLDDGLLTAAEAAWLDLSGTELVTISGCESGLGVARAGESLLGLRRALYLAGARATVTALWRVGDAETSTLMTAFYGTLLTKKCGNSAALRVARLDMLARNRAMFGGQGLPGTWGAFVLDGGWK